MLLDPLPIHTFVSRFYETAQVQRVVENWRIEGKLIVDKLVEHCRDMGVYWVGESQKALIQADLLRHLKNSPEILKLVVRARQDEARRVRNRHTD